jgi:hypothetical protein
MSLRRFTIHTEYTEEELEHIRNGEPLVVVPEVEAEVPYNRNTTGQSGHTIRPEPARLRSDDPGGDIRLSSNGQTYRHILGNWSVDYRLTSITGKPVVTGRTASGRDLLNPRFMVPLGCRAITSSNVSDSRPCSALIVCGTTGALKIRHFVSTHKRIFSEYAFYNGLLEEFDRLGLAPANGGTIYQLNSALHDAVTDEDMFTYIRRA